jgi:hypothetical protein
MHSKIVERRIVSRNKQDMYCRLKSQLGYAIWQHCLCSKLRRYTSHILLSKLLISNGFVQPNENAGPKKKITSARFYILFLGLLAYGDSFLTSLVPQVPARP